MGTTGIKNVIANIFTKTIPLWVKEHRTGMMVGIGIGGFIFTGVWCCKATLDAKKAIDIRKSELKTEKLPFVEVIKVAGKYYIIPLTTATLSAISIIAAHKKDQRAYATLAALYSTSEATLQEYMNKTKELIGEKKERDIREAVAQEIVTSNPPTKENSWDGNGVYGTEWFLEPITGQYFKSDWKSIYNAVAKLREESIRCGDGTYSQISFDEYISALETVGYPHRPNTPVMNHMGWDSERGMLYIQECPDATLAPDGTHCGCIDYVNRLAEL